jgi:RNA polymerase sigma factor (sigma-70 family)
MLTKESQHEALYQLRQYYPAEVINDAHGSSRKTNVNTPSDLQNRSVRREQQEAFLRTKDPHLRKLSAEHKQEEFFRQITPLLNSLKSYIKRRLRIAYLDLQIRTPVYTSGDILDEVVLRAYANYEQRPEELTLEHWLYRIANEVLEKRLNRQASTDTRRKSLEDLTASELRTPQERITADAEGEVILVEDLDDSEYQQSGYVPLSSSDDDPEKILERKERLFQILHALSRVPQEDRIAFELFAVEGFSKEEVAKILNVSPEAVEEIVKRVKTEVAQELQSSRRPREPAESIQKAS